MEKILKLSSTSQPASQPTNLSKEMENIETLGRELETISNSVGSWGQ
jgi:hypothetical protein